MNRIPRNLPIQLGLSLLIFLALMAIYWLFVEKPRHKVDIANSYADLVSALGTQNLLPPVGDDAMISSLTAMTIDPRRIRAPQGSSVGLSELGLGDVLTARVMNAEVFRIELKPQQWRELQPGLMRDSLRRIARMPLVGQQASASAIHSQPASSMFAFQESYGGRTYEITPVFEQDICVLLMLTEMRE